MINSAGVTSSSSTNPEWRRVNLRIDQISSLKSRFVTELRKEHDNFRRTQDATKPSVVMRYQDSRKKAEKEEIMRHDAVYSSRDMYSLTTNPMLEAPKVKKNQSLGRRRVVTQRIR